jgi:prolyl-tRNA synthetase
MHPTAMRTSRLFVQTQRETPADAEVISHQLLVKAGYIKRLTSGVYSYLPLMWRVLQKISAIVSQEMDAAGAQQLHLPVLQPAELWQETGRWERFVQDGLLMHFNDRHERPLALGPTHEEVITDVARQQLKSYRQLPTHLYQIQTKFRDEPRPRFGLLRGREFIMKDGYSFHASQACLDKEYDVMAQTYYRIFERCGLQSLMVQSDSGAIGGAVSHEFMVLTHNLPDAQQSGENDVIFAKDDAGNVVYAANIEKAEASQLAPAVTDGAEIFVAYSQPTEVPTPNATTIEILCKQLAKLTQRESFPPSLILKTLYYKVMLQDGSETPVLVLIRGDLQVEETKLLNQVSNAVSVRLATDEELAQDFGTSKGFLGLGHDLATFDGLAGEGPHPTITTHKNNRLVIDTSVLALQHFVVATGQKDVHLINQNFKDASWFKPYAVNIATARVGDLFVDADGNSFPLQLARGIEVGNIFQLGTKYSQAMKATFTDEDGSEKPYIMGCYGLGVSRVAAAAVEQHHDANGLCWPVAIAPYHLVIVPANVKDDAQKEAAETLYTEALKAGLEVVLDDRDERAGVKFKDADLIGYPLRITVGKSLATGQVEVKPRTANEPILVATTEAIAWAKTWLTPNQA